VLTEGISLTMVGEKLLDLWDLWGIALSNLFVQQSHYERPKMESGGLTPKQGRALSNWPSLRRYVAYFNNAGASLPHFVAVAAHSV